MKRWQQRPPGSNWGDFGADDQRGRMNLLTPERRLRALAEVKDGEVHTLSLPLDYPGGSVLLAYRQPPRLFAERRGSGWFYNYRFSEVSPDYTDVVSDDAVTLHTQYSTQWDGLGHAGSLFDADGDGVPEAVFYNGYRAGQHLLGPDDEGGPCACALGIEQFAMAGVQGRGTLIDLQARHGRERVAVGYDALMAAIDAQGAEVLAGDFLCLYTGFADALLAMNRQPDAATLAKLGPGLDGRDKRLLNWITDSGIVAICADNPAVELLPGRPVPGQPHAMMPLHEHCLFKLGIHLGELWYLTELANALRQRGRSHFLLTAPPLRLPGSVGSPVTPIATI